MSRSLLGTPILRCQTTRAIFWGTGTPPDTKSIAALSYDTHNTRRRRRRARAKGKNLCKETRLAETYIVLV